MEIKIGARTSRVPYCGNESDGRRPAIPCTVVYVHPWNRFYTVRYNDFGFRESFLMEQARVYDDPPPISKGTHHNKTLYNLGSGGGNYG